MIVGILFFLLLFFSAPAISRFLNEPKLSSIIQILGIVLIIDSLSLIQRTILTKQINFKLQAKISIIASLISGFIAITMAYNGLGVWALVAQRIIRQGVNTIFLWLWSNWKPMLIFSKKSFNDLFGFGSKLLISGLIETIYSNIYYLIIGKYFSARELGFYTKADEFKNLPANNLNSIIGRVTYPILSTMQGDIKEMRRYYQKLIKTTMFVTFIMMIGMASVAEPMIITLIGSNWEPAIIYLQMLCFVGMMYPLHALNLNMLQVLGRSDLFLKLEIIKKIIAVPIIIIGIIWGIKAMIIGMMINSLIAYYLNSYWSGINIGYSFKQQIKDILPSFTLAITMGFIVFIVGRFIPFSYMSKLIIQIATGSSFIIIICEILKFKDYVFTKQLIMEQIYSFKPFKKL
jgi:O-antigen/teichoic acid export membrane protein